MSKVDLLEQDIFDKSPKLLNLLLSDKTTGGFLRWGTNDYAALGLGYTEDKEIKPELVIGSNTRLIQPRSVKSAAEQQRRTRDKAEVFTPLWVCNAQNNLVDEAWFGRSDVFNTVEGKGWIPSSEPITFDENRSWIDYVKKNVLEMACGEAPYLVSRYDPTTGEKIPIGQRIGLLDRKMRVVNENVGSEQEWRMFADRAFKSTYGFDYQGDNVILARENLLMTYQEFFFNKFGRKPDVEDLEEIAEIIAWNIWQMDGLDGTCPFFFTPDPSPIYLQDDLFGFSEPEQAKRSLLSVQCKIFDWETNRAIEYVSLLKG